MCLLVISYPALPYNILRILFRDFEFTLPSFAENKRTLAGEGVHLRLYERVWLPFLSTTFTVM